MNQAEKEKPRENEIDDNVVAMAQQGRVVHVKPGYGFITPENKNFDDLIFFMVDVEPWRHGFKQLTGPMKEPFFRGEKVKFDIRRTNKIVKGRQGYQAINIEILEGM